MIVSKNTEPENDLYYIGSLVINSLDSPIVDFFELFKRVSAIHSMSVTTFALALDWLFLLGAVESDKNFIKKCF